MTADTMECPFCAEIIKAKAKKCRYCDEYLEVGLTDEAILAQHENGEAASNAEAEAPPPVVVTSDEGDAEADSDPLGELYQKLSQMPDSPEKEMILQTLQQLAEEIQKGEEAKEGAVADMVKTVVKVLPDMAEITISTMINPAGGLLSLAKKVASKVVKDNSESEESDTKEAAENDTQEPREEASGSTEVDVEAAAEALEEVQEQLEQLPDSPESELVKEALQQLETESQEDEESDKGVVRKLLDKAVDTAQDVAKETAKQVVEEVVEG